LVRAKLDHTWKSWKPKSLKKRKARAFGQIGRYRRFVIQGNHLSHLLNA